MKCEACLNQLEEYLDAELGAHETDEIRAHLITCASCATEFAALTADQELFTRYDRELAVPATLWKSIAAQTLPVAPVVEPVRQRTFWSRFAEVFAIPSFSFVGAAAVILLALAVGAAYLLTRPQPNKESANNGSPVEAPGKTPEQQKESHRPVDQPTVEREKRPVLAKARKAPKPVVVDDSDIVSSELAYVDAEDQDTAKHIEQTQNLLRSIRNVNVSDADEDIDVTYDKALSRRLLNDNIVLRRDAEMKAKFPTKALLSDLEPILIDIANLPDQAKPEDVRVIKERVQKTEIVAELLAAGDFR